MWGLTPHGGCVGSTSVLRGGHRPPIITLHPALLLPTEKSEPWGIRAEWLGASLAFDVLLHECIHVHIANNLGGTTGRSSHDCKRWTRQVNRIAPLLGFNEVKAAGTKLVRVSDPEGRRTSTGKLPTRVARVPLGNIPMQVVAGFPMALRTHLGRADDHYRRNLLPDGAPSLN